MRIVSKVFWEQSTNQIAQIQTRPYISITEATVLFGISKDTIRRLIKAGKNSRRSTWDNG